MRSSRVWLRATAATVLTLALVWAAAWPRAGWTDSPPPSAAKRSGFDYMGKELQAMQRDDTSNPGMLWVQEGLQRWSSPEGPQGKACASCHGATPAATLREAASRHPAWDAQAQRPITLAGRIAQCRSRHQGADPAARGAADAVLALETAVAHASRGLAMNPPDAPQLAAWRERGAALWQQRIGQLNLSCAQCHDDRAGRRLGGAVIPPGNASGYPTYRLEWQAVGALTRRLRNCMTGVRAEPVAPDSDESLALQVYMAWRDRGLPVEAPAVRP